MDEKKRIELTRLGGEIHEAVENAYLAHPATKNVPADWLEKQRLLLADMAIHLLRTAIKPGPIEPEKLKNNLHAILTISEQFLPHAKLKKATWKLYAESQPAAALSRDGYCVDDGIQKLYAADR